uniref:Uncharacterized protein n=1 Tax=Arabidopsis thaliana TaxID=3702 RepID=Q0WLR5_ARATH|nr:hypothetical protein [Arabidopsis thaliana]
MLNKNFGSDVIRGRCTSKSLNESFLDIPCSGLLLEAGSTTLLPPSGMCLLLSTPTTLSVSAVSILSCEFAADCKRLQKEFTFDMTDFSSDGSV